MTDSGNDGAVLLFDGVCNLCNGAVNFIIDRDPHGKIKFAALQSVAGKALIAKYLSNEEVKDSLIFIENGKAYQQSTAALRLTRHLNAAWPMAFIFIIIPAFIRNWIYAYVAKNRYKWFGTLESCRMPTPELKARFLV
jgi:predicted DCC family thiol-disulfide oxidoreductase YuxK